MLTHPIILAGESHGQRRLAGYSQWGHKESDTTEQLTLSLFTIRQQCLCLSIVTTYFHSFFLTLESNLTLLNQERQSLLRKSDCPHGKLLMPEKSSLKDQRLSFIYHHLHQLHPPKVAAYHGAEYNVEILMKNLEKRTNLYIVPLNTILDVYFSIHESESEVSQSCPTLCDPMDCSLPGSSAHGIFLARILE